MGEKLVTILQTFSAMCDPSVSNDVRLRAYKTWEEMKKSNAPMVNIELGFVLARNMESRWNPSIVHSGLQLVQDTIEAHWPVFTVEQKIGIKETTKDLVRGLIMVEEYILDGSAKIFVEIIKREWPQQWPAMLQEMEVLSNDGNLQLQVVSLVFLRVVEDLVQFHVLPTVRHREIAEALTAAMPDFILFLVRCLRKDLPSVSNIILRLCTTLAEFSQVKFLWEGNGILFDTLFSHVVKDDGLHMEAAGFLCGVFGRKYPKADVQLVLQLFSETKYLVALIQLLDRFQLDSSEKTYTVFKKYVEVFSAIANQLVQSAELAAYLQKYGSSFRMYVEKLEELGKHASPGVDDMILNAWLALWGNKITKSMHVIAGRWSSLLNMCYRLSLTHKLESDPWLELDFQHQEQQFREFLAGHRMKITELVRRISADYPKESLEFSFNHVSCLIRDLSLEQNLWSAALRILDGCTKVVPDNVKMQFLPTPFRLIEELIAVDSTMLPRNFSNPQLTSLRLSIISKLATTFILNPSDEHCQMSCQAMQQVLKYNLLVLTSTATVSSDPPKEELHFHARNLFTHFARSLSKQMALRYDQLLSDVCQLFDTATYRLTPDDQCALLDGLITVTRDCNDPAKTDRLLREILATVLPFWVSSEFTTAVSTPENLVRFCGFDQSDTSLYDNPELLRRRSQIYFCTHVIASTFMFMKYERAQVEQLLGNGFSLIRCLMSFYLPNVTLLFSGKDLVAMPEASVQTLLRHLFADLPKTTKIETPGAVLAKRVQNWLQCVFESACRLLGYAGRCFEGFYAIPDLVVPLNASVLQFVACSTVPIYRLQTVIRELIAPYIRNCPIQQAKLSLIPVLKIFCPSVAVMLNAAWSTIDCESDERTEIIQTVLLRAFTKDYCNFVLQRTLKDQPKSLDGSSADIQDTEMAMAGSDDECDERVMAGDKKQTKGQNNPQVMSSLGLLCLEEADLTEAILNTVFNGLWWPDSSLSFFLTPFAQMLLPHLVKKGVVNLNASAVRYILQCVLNALRVHGQHETNQVALINLGICVYYHVKPLFPSEIVEVLSSGTPNAQKQAAVIKQLDIILFERANDTANLYAKAKRDCFKKVVADYIGRHLSELEKLEVFIPNLPSVTKQKSALNVRNFDQPNLQDLFCTQR